MKKTLLAVALAPLCLQSSLVSAQNTTEETMVVIGRSVHENSIESIPANVAVISQNEIKSSGAQDLTSLLRGRAGIQVSDTNSGPVFSLRGFSGGQAASNTLILVDGRKLNRNDLSSPNLNAIALNQVDKVEILSGSAGVLYGDQAVGGVINIITKSPESTGGSVGATAGSYDTYGYRGDVSGRINEDWHYYLAGNQTNSDNYRKHNASEDGSILGKVQFLKGDKRFFLEVSYLDSHRDYAGSLTEEQFNENPKQANPTFPDDYSHEISTVYRTGYRQSIAQNWDMSTEISYEEADTRGISYSANNTKKLDNLYGTLQLESGLPLRNGEVNILLGVDYSDTGFDYLGSSFDRDNDQQTLSAYGQLNVPLLDDLTALIGGRYSSVEDKLRDKTAYPTGQSIDNDAHALELAFNYLVDDKQRLYVRYDQNFRFAKVDEQAYTSAGVVGLKPQTGDSIEAGWSFSDSVLMTSLNVYRLDLQDEIVFDSSAPAPNGGLFPGANVNADATRRYGVDVSVVRYLTDAVSVGAEYHYVDAEFTQGPNKNKNLSWVAPHTGRAFGTLVFMHDWQLFAESVYTGSKYRDGDNANAQDKVDDYWLFNTALSYTANRWQATLRVDNLADKSYASSVYDWGAYYSGDGRKATLSVDYQF
ncbi:TonB-dependent receptor [Photobacterium sp. 1_MG-2023]|uniref:TonB-dependent receptor n=1 Tax=Photobacterium sp. 1_MG-2023 TaxID=3062646 RepID=UPI0026E2BA92|nr:TonB-dependent receptor [Photobacterium sp. 1_MG-2023]MDO6707494.1 TonB-dependent receptor [Photobacterium sp. 1_MG-2023]